MLKKMEGKRIRGQQRMKLLDGITESMDMSLRKLREIMEKEMATHFSILAWRSPWTEDPGGLLSMGSHRGDTTKRLSTAQNMSFK